MRSGNVNFTLPLVGMKGRAGLGGSIALHYNSQNWRRDPAGMWRLGSDVGFGFGWRLGIGSVQRFYNGSPIAGYIYTDGTGTEYVLNQQSGPYWTSKDATYVTYDGVNDQLRFNDGTWWQMGQISDPLELDAGTRYPVTIQDSNGNQIKLRYQASGSYSSARLTEIEDVRAKLMQSNPNVYKTYTMHYDSSAPPHLTSIESHIDTGENYGFTYDTNTLTSAIAPNTSFGQSKFLRTMSNTVNGYAMTYTFDTRPAGVGLTGEMSKVTFPYGGNISWVHQDWTYPGNRTLRQAYYREFQATPGGAALEYGITLENNSSKNLHGWGEARDFGAGAQKKWSFDETQGAGTYGLPVKLEEFQSTPYKKLTESVTSWAQDPGQRWYAKTSQSTMDPGTGSAKTTKSEVTLDVYGNATNVKKWDFGNLSTPAREYNFTYRHNEAPNGADYVNDFLRNRVTNVTMTQAAVTGTDPSGSNLVPTAAAVQLVTNQYDNYSTAALQDWPNLYLHDTTYGTAKARRGNLTHTTSNNVQTMTAFDIGGMVTKTSKGGLSYWTNSYTEVQRNATDSAPAVILPNGPNATGQNQNDLKHTLTWNNFLGLTHDLGPNGVLVTVGYDAWARPSVEKSPHGAVETRHEYLDWLRQKKSTVWDVTNANAQKKLRFTKTTMDGIGRPVKVESGYHADPANPNSAEVVLSVVETEYAACGCTPVGKVKRTSLPYAPVPGVTKYWTEYNYDGIGRTVSVVQPNGSGTTSYLYEGNAVKVTDAAGKWKKSYQNAFGHLTMMEEPHPVSGAWFTHYTYDERDKLRKVTMPRDNGVIQYRDFAYNTQGQMTSVTNPENGTTNFSYNADGTLNYKTDAKGQKIEYIYDSYRRVRFVNRYKTGQSTPEADQQAEMVYDLAPTWDVGGVQNGWGRLTGVVYRVDGATGSTYFRESYSYGASGLVTKKRIKVERGAASGTLESNWEYDPEGKMTSVKHPDAAGVTGRKFAFGFDNMARPNSMKEVIGGVPGSEWLGAVSYNASGQVTAMAGVNYQYNPLQQLTSISGGPWGGSIAYNYSATANNGRIVSSTDSWGVTGETTSYEYDRLNRVTSATGSGWSAAYVHDGFGNLQSKTYINATTTSWSMGVNQANNRENGRTYDLNGNDISGSMNYDVENRLVEPASNVRYGFDAANKRVYKKVNATEEVHFFGLAGRRMAVYEMSVAGASITFFRKAEWYNLGGKTVKRMAMISGTPVDNYVYTDRLGSVLNEPGTGGSQARLRYYPYGEHRSGPTDLDRDKFGTYYRDAETGLDYADQRFYGSTSGRFLTSDPYLASGGAGDPGSLNRYGYTMGDPINANDPSGLLTIVVPGFTLGSELIPGWAQSGSPFMNAIAATFGETPHVYLWSRTHFIGWDAAAEGLEAFIQLLLGVDTNDPVNIIAHSDGGNVAKAYTWIPTARPIDVLITFGIPQLNGFRINNTKVGTYLNVYSKHDVVQSFVAGKSWWSVAWTIGLGLAGAPLGGWGIVGGSVLGWLLGGPGRTDPCAINIGMDRLNGIGNVGHGDYLTPQGWAALLGWLNRAGYQGIQRNATVNYCNYTGGGPTNTNMDPVLNLP